MRLARIARHRLRSLLRRSRAESEMQRELALHIEQLTKQNMAAGMTAAEARLQARREFGPLERTKEECRDMRGVNLIEDVTKDVGYALRLLRKSPGFTLTAVLSLALGIGANTAIFSVVNAFLLRPLPFAQPERLVAAFERNVLRDEQEVSVAPGNFLDWQKTSTSFEQMAAYTTNAATLSADSPGFAAERVVLCMCSGNLFTALGVSPVVGRRFHPEEDRFGAPRLAVISYGLWQRQFGGSAETVGRAIRLDGNSFQIIGVMPRGFMFPYRNVEVWVPYLTGSAPRQQVRHDLHFLQVIGRLRPGVSVEQARAEIDGIAARYRNAHPDVATGKGANVVPLHSRLVQDVRRPLVILLGGVGCVLLIACVNIANLVLTRAAGRAREIAMRAALGATRGRIIRQLVTESVLVALAGGAVGAILAVSITGVLVAHAPGADAVLPSGKIPVDPMVFVFAFGIALVTGIAVGLFPAVRVSRADLAHGLKDAARSSTMTRAHGHFRNALVSAEVALSLVLLIAAGLLLRSFFLLYQVHPGVRLDHTLTMAVSLPGASYRDVAKRSALLSELGERVNRVPGVASAGLVSCAPLTGSCNILFFYIEGRPFVSGNFLTALDRAADLSYFAAAGIPLLRGRTFTPGDGVGWDVNHPRLGSIVISESMAKTFFPNEDPIGKRIFFDFEVQAAKIFSRPVPHYEVIGVVGDVPPALDRKPGPTLYRPLLDVAYGGATILLHTAGNPQSLITAVRNEIRRLDPNLAVYRIQTMRELLGISTSDRRFTMLLFAAFAGLALLLATVGLYGLVSYTVSQRRAEVGIRMALGATGPDVRRLILMQGLKPATTGIVLGVVAAALAARILRSQLFGVTPVDPLTFAAVPLVLLAVAAVACYVPAIRATRLDPTAALRTE
jgi:predicted permease